jgi:putative membrane protein
MIMLIGFMVGSMGSVWPFFTYDYLVNPLQIKKGPELNILEPYLPSLSNPELYYFSIVAIVGIFAVYFLDSFAKSRRTA